MTGTGRAHGKVILLGEHSVVYGLPAIAVPVPALRAHAFAQRSDIVTQARPLAGETHTEMRFRVGNGGSAPLSGPRVAVEHALRDWSLTGEPVEIAIGCDIPAGRGLGASAACAAAAVRAVADLYGREVDAQTVYHLVQFGEQCVYGRVSGVDARTALCDVPIWFERGVWRPLAIGARDLTVVIADSGVAAATKDAVTTVSASLGADPDRAGRLLATAAAFIGSAADAVAAGDAQALGRSMVEFHEFLTQLGVGTAGIDALVAAALGAGSLGAKVTGGGLGGCVLALTQGRASADRVGAALLAAGAVQVWTVPIAQAPS
ncbi:mevalonate kinase [Nocardia terpenica]|nr:mevalonate kinase [Nocardia terpenica]